MIPRIKERNYISVVRGSGCSSSVGRQGGKQKLKLGPNCMSSVGVVIHELMHAVGKQYIYLFSSLRKVNRLKNNL